MGDLIELLGRFDQRYPRRARGGLYALAGFDLQLRAHLADFAQRLALGDNVYTAGEEFLEAFSDFTRQEGSQTVCVQVKRTLNAASMARAALEFVLIDEFLEEEAPHLQGKITFEVLSQFSGVASPSMSPWSDVQLPDNTVDRENRQARLGALRAKGRLLAPRIEPDPWWRLSAAVYPVLDDPFAFAREALEICLRRGVKPEHAADVRNQIAEAFYKRRLKAPTLPGEVVTPDEIQPLDTPSQEVVLGDVPTVTHLRDGRFMERRDKLAQAIEALDNHLAEREWRHEPQIYTFWIDGRSGNGKSVLLLQLMRELVLTRKARVIWLDDASENLLPLLQAWAASPEMNGGPCFVFVDDFNAPHKRDEIEFDAIARLLRQHSEIEWPVLVTCGPPEQHQEVKSSGHDEAFRICTWRLTPVDVTERDLLKRWFESRTGEAPKTGSAFEQDERLMISMVFEMRQGDLARFGHRFRRRLEGENLVEALALPLALNRLYIWVPSGWLSEEQGDALRRINQDKDFSILSPEVRSGGYLRLTHPHLSDAIYRAIRARGDQIVFARDLANAFAKALETDPAVASRILHRVAEAYERLEGLDPWELTHGMTKAWADCQPVETKYSREALADIWTNWALWAYQQPNVATLLGGDHPVDRARAALATDHQYWGVLWSHLWDCRPGHAGLAADARAWLRRECAQRNRHWSMVWEKLFDHERISTGSASEGLLSLAARWLEANEFELDWNYVFRPLAGARPDLVPWNASMRLLDELPTNRNWAYIFPLVADAGHRFSQERRRQTSSAAWRWLTTLEAKETPEWAFVWQKLLEYRDDLPEEVKFIDLLQEGLGWLQGREDRAEWAFVWRKLLEYRGDLPEEVKFIDLLQEGLGWLQGREDRDGWAFVWQNLLEYRDDLPEEVRVSGLLALGWGWLSSGENPSRGEWDKIYEACLLAGLREPDFLEAGVQWVIANESQPQAYGIAERILLSLRGLTESHPLVAWAKRWLAAHHGHPSWSYVWEALWLAYPNVSTAELILPWIQSGAKEGAMFVVLKRVLRDRRPEILDLVSLWCWDYRREPWAAVVQGCLPRDMC